MGLLGRRRELRKLRLSNNTDDTARQLEETVPAFKDGNWLQDLYFYCDCVPATPKVRATGHGPREILSWSSVRASWCPPVRS